MSFLSVDGQEADGVSIKFQIYLWPGAVGLDDLSEGAVAPKPQRRQEEGAEIIDEDIPYFIYYKKSDGSYEKIKMYSGLITKGSFRYSGVSRMQFFTKQTAVDGEIEYAPYGSIDIPTSYREVTIILFGAGENGCRMLPVNTSLESIPEGKVAIYNLSKSPLACSLLHVKFEMEPMSHKLMDLNMDGVYRPILIASQGVNGGWERRLVRKLTVNAGSTNLWVIYNRGGGDNRFGLLNIPGIDHAN